MFKKLYLLWCLHSIKQKQPNRACKSVKQKAIFVTNLIKICLELLFYCDGVKGILQCMYLKQT